MKAIAEMVDEYKANLDALRKRRDALIEERQWEPHFELRHKLTARIIALDKCIGSSTAALRAMQDYLAD